MKLFLQNLLNLLTFKLDLKRWLNVSKYCFWSIVGRLNNLEQLCPASQLHSRPTCTDVHKPKRARSRSTDRSTVVKIGRPTVDLCRDRPTNKSTNFIYRVLGFSRSTAQWTARDNGSLELGSVDRPVNRKTSKITFMTPIWPGFEPNN